MNKFLYIIIFCFIGLSSNALFAGNPDRQGEAGAYELLMNPWARSSGLHTMTTSFVTGVEAMRLNVAGLSRINNMEVQLSHARYLVGTDINMNAFGLAKKIGKGGSLGVSLMALDLGEIKETTEQLPEGTGATFSPNFFHLGLGYAHQFDNKISVGLLVRAVSESTADLSASTIALDAGVQYVTGPQDNFKFGISLRNVGAPMKYTGQGLAVQLPAPGNGSYNNTYEGRGADFEIPSVLNIGTSYDFIFAEKHRLTILGNFTANSFSRDNVGGGFEFSMNDMFMLRAGYKYELGSTSGAFDNAVYTGLSGGVTVQVPLGKESDNRFAIDYAYRTTNPFSGTHNIAIRFAL